MKHLLQSIIFKGEDMSGEVIIHEREVYLDGKRLNPSKSQKVVNHSPDGFSWGYDGSGPAQLALSVLLELLPQEEALAKYQDFKRTKIATLEQDKEFELEFEL